MSSYLYTGLTNLIQASLCIFFILFFFPLQWKAKERERRDLQQGRKIVPGDHPLFSVPSLQSSAGQTEPQRKEGKHVGNAARFHCLSCATLKPHYSEHYQRNSAERLQEPCTCSRRCSRQGSHKAPLCARLRLSSSVRGSGCWMPRDRHGTSPARHREPRPAPWSKAR